MKTARREPLIGAFLALLAAGAQAQTTAFTYQGQLKNSGTPVNGNYDFKFELYDALSFGTLLGTVNQTLPVNGGLFTANLDYGNQFPGANRWLQISVRVTGGGSYTLLMPRQALTPAPYAIGLELPFVGATSHANPAFAVTNNSSGAGMAGTSTTGPGVSGINTAETATTSAGVVGLSTQFNGNGVAGFADVGNNAYGVYGEASAGYAIYGNSTSGTGVYAVSSTGPAVHGVNYGSTATTSAGVVGESQVSDGNGVSGIADTGVFAYGVYGEASFGYAGYFNGNAYVNGTLSKAGGSFKIDHPLDPANKYLSHSFVESPDMKNVYDGVVTTDADGYATVTLPAWFQALNRDFRYQLTVIDDSDRVGFVQAKIVARVDNNQFTLRTSEPQTTVSWQVTGVRQDPWANAHRIPVEQEKPALERGLYLHPELYGAPAELGAQAAKVRAAALNRSAAAQQLPAEKAPVERPMPAAPDTHQTTESPR